MAVLCVKLNWLVLCNLCVVFSGVTCANAVALISVLRSPPHQTLTYTEQEAELLHRNRAAGWVSFGAAMGGSLYVQNLRLRGCRRSNGTLSEVYQWLGHRYSKNTEEREKVQDSVERR